jgi:DNA-binding NarL/FixJ family response regulator
MDDADGRLIFFVDDDKLILNLMEYVFQSKNGYRIRTFSSGEECLSNIYLNPDLIILDYYFGESSKTKMNGLDIFKELKVRNVNAPVIVLSGYTDDKIKEEFYSLGVRGFVPKDDFFVDVLEKAISEEFVQPD